MSTPPLPRSIGTAERSLRALLERELGRSHLSFPQWIALVFTSTGPLPLSQVIQRQLAGQVVTSEAAAKEAINHLLVGGLLSSDDAGNLTHTDKGGQTFASLSAAVQGITTSLYGDLPPSDLEATHRTLLEIGNRAATLLAVT